MGCRLNQAETDQIAEDLARLGFEVVPESSDPDVVVINTCTVTNEASRSSRRAASKAATDHPGALVVMAGCYVAAEPEEAAAIPGVGLTATNDDKANLARTILEAGHLLARPAHPTLSGPPLIQLGGRPTAGTPGSDRTRVNLKVQTGCDEFCSFCIIPKTRGPLQSLPMQELIERAERLVADGGRELVLTGVHLGKYGWDVGRPDDDLVELLERLLRIDDLSRIRLSSILCRHLTPRVVSLIAQERRICRFLHVPLQSGSDDVLAAMNRPYRIGEYLETIDTVKRTIPGVGLSTDVIVGFPGETDDDFEATMSVAREVGYLKIHVFRYSNRPGTPGSSMGGQIPEPVKKQRSKQLIALGNETRSSIHRSLIGRSVEVFVEEAFDSGDLAGHTDAFVMVRFAGPRMLAGRLARVAVTEAAVESVRGDLIEEVPWGRADPRHCPELSSV